MTQGKHSLILLFPSVEDTLLNYLTPPVLNTLQEIFLNKNDKFFKKLNFSELKIFMRLLIYNVVLASSVQESD